MTPQAAAGVSRCARTHRAEAAPRATAPPCGEERALYPVRAASPYPLGDGATKGRRRGILLKIPRLTPHPGPLPRERESTSPTKTIPTPFAPWDTACGFRDGRHPEDQLPAGQPGGHDRSIAGTGWSIGLSEMGMGSASRWFSADGDIQVRWPEAPPSTRSCAACTDSPPILAPHSFFPEARQRYPGPTGDSSLQGGVGWSRVFARER